MALGQTIAKGVNKVANKIATTELPKVPRWGGTEMSPVANNNGVKILGNQIQHIDDMKNNRVPTTDADAIVYGSPIGGVAPAVGFMTDVASVPVNFARNVYNTAADAANAKIAEHNAKATQRKANTRKRILKKKMEPIQAISL